MIGVLANPFDHAVVCEFFELFKTPWEFYQIGQQYEVLLCAGDHDFDKSAAKLIVIYAGGKLAFDAKDKTPRTSQGKKRTILSYKGTSIPIYGDSVTFPGNVGSVLVDAESQQSAMCLQQSATGTIARIGYDLFAEVRALLTAGQPAAHAGAPTLDIHIVLLRDFIVGSGISLIEIPPIPDGYNFIACLTHDVDHPLIRKHKFDHTMFGFVYRAMFVSLSQTLRGRTPFRHLVKNWAAVLKLPFVYMGLAQDFWGTFDDYTKFENGLPSSFYVIPFANTPGRIDQKQASQKRAAGYGAAHIADQIQTLMAAGCEIGLHGIDAWRDIARGEEELQEIRRVAATHQEIGVRMHWLYFNEQSPAVLERAGSDYDSTIGYNETIGYRAGTGQVYKPLQTTRLLELPLHIMDTALFYPSYLNLSRTEANARVADIIDNAARWGGVVTVNWHDRSIAPERLWGDSYADVIAQLKSRGAWFSTASQAVSWFRKRRSVVFQDSCEPGQPRTKVIAERAADLPGFRLRVYNAPEDSQFAAGSAVTTEYVRGIEFKTHDARAVLA